jgi:hypothetical protein
MINLSPTTDNRTFVLTERVDVGPGYNLLALARTEEDLADLPKSGLINYLAHARKHGGKVQVRYTDPGIGRLNMAVVTTDKRGNETAHEMITQAQVWNYAKAACCTEYYRDVDICNCHPELLVQMAEHHGLSCPQLREYNESRQKLITDSGLNKRDFKALFYKAVLYHPQCTDEQLQHKLREFGLESEPRTFKELRTEICAISSKLLELYPCYTAHAVQVKGAEYFNIPGTALSYMVQTAEKRCILALHDYFASCHVEIGALIHDGLHMTRADELTDSHTKLACEHVTKQTGYTVELSEKPFEAYPLMSHVCIAQDMADCVNHAHGILAGRIIRSGGRVWFRDAFFQWHSEKDDVLRLIAAEVSRKRRCVDCL